MMKVTPKLLKNTNFGLTYECLFIVYAVNTKTYTLINTKIDTSDRPRQIFQ